ncbi:DUF6907 domain-containing protein [Nocardioides pyridinolyticus]
MTTSSTTVRTVNLNCPDWCVDHVVDFDAGDPHGGTTSHSSRAVLVETGLACGLPGEARTFEVSIEAATRISDGQPRVHFAAAELPVYVRLEDNGRGEACLRPEEARELATALITSAEQVEARL